MPEKTRAIGPYSRPNTLAKLDGRTREAALMRRVRADLTAHVGGNPTATERAMIERAVWLSLRLAQLDAKMAAGDAFTIHDSNHYIAWSNALTRTLARLGFKAAAATAPSLAEIMREATAQREREGQAA